MASRWIKACFLLVLGIVILLYADKLVQDLRVNAEGHFNFAFEWTWTLLTWLLWLLVAWLLVDAGLTVALSFTEHKHTISEVVDRLDGIEKRLGITESTSTESAVISAAEPRKLIEIPSVEPAAEEVPPPPRE